MGKTLVHTTDEFSYHKDTHTFVTEASTLGWQLWFGAFTLRSTRTGNVVKCRMVDQKIQGDELRSVTYEPEDPEMDWSVTIFND